MSDIGKDFKLFIEGSPTVDGLPGQKPTLAGSSASMIIGDELHGDIELSFVDKELLRQIAEKGAEIFEAEVLEAYRRYAGIANANAETLAMIAKIFGIPPEKLK